MKAIVVLSLDCEPEDLPKVIDHMEPPKIPHFSGEIRIAMEAEAEYVLNWLDE